jgi:hypothetical protein
MGLNDSKRRAPNAPPGCFWQDGVLWGKVKVPGQHQYFKWSLRTTDAKVAIQRWMLEGQQHSRPAVDVPDEEAHNSPSEPFCPRGMTVDRAAYYVGLDRARFLTLVTSGRMPEPFEIEGVEIWDRHELDAAFGCVLHRTKRGGCAPT